jgi:hypothetical protein
MKNASKFIIVIILFLPLLLSQCKKLTEDPDCLFPANVNVTNITNVSAEANWTAAEDASQYLFEYRKVGTTGYTVLRITSGTTAKIINLASGSTYEYRVQTNCPGSNSNYSELKQFKTISNNEFNIVKKWRMKFFKENNVEVALGANDYLNFTSSGGLTQSLTVSGSPVVSNGTWAFFSNNDSLNISLSSAKKWRIESLSTTNFLLVKNSAAPLTTVDSLRLEAF